MRTRQLLTMLGFILSTAFFAHAATYHASPSLGDNSRSCATAQTASTPKLTISDATGLISCMTTPGDIGLLRAGTYVENINNASTPTWVSGTSGSRLTLRNYPSEVAIIQPSGGASAVDFNRSDGPDYWTFDGTNRLGLIFDCQNLSNTGPTACITGNQPSVGLTLQNLTIRNTANNGTGTISQGVIYGGNDFTSTNVRVDGTHNQFGDNDGEHCYYLAAPGNNVIVQSGLIENCGAAGIQFNDSRTGFPINTGGIIRNNIIKNAGQRPSNAKIGIVVNNNQSGTLVYNNIVTDTFGGPGIAVYGDGPTAGVRVYNNTIVGNDGNCIQVGNGAGKLASGTLLENNICQGNGAGITTYAGSTSTTAVKNVVYSSGVALTHGGTGSVAAPLTGNPLFTNISAGNFHLLTGSSAIDTCTNTSATNPTDSAGTTYSIPYECGVYNFGTTVTPLLFVFSTPPTSVYEDTIMTPSVVVCVEDSGGVPQTTFANNITLTLTTGAGVLTGGGATAPVGGCSTFAISIDTAGAGDKLTASGTGATSTVSNAFNVNATPVASAPALPLKLMQAK